MSQDLASLVIKLSADVASLQSDMGKAVNVSKSAADQISAGFTKSLGAAGDVVKEFAGTLIAAFAVDKIIEVGKAVIDLGDTFNKMSQKVGVSVEALSALNNAAKLSDVGLDQLQNGMVKLAKTSADAAAGGKESAAAYAAIGVSVKDANGNLKPTQQILEDVATKFASYADGAGKTAEAQKIFGKSGADLIPLLNQLGKDGFGAVTQAAKDYNQIIGGEQAKQSEEFNDNLTRLTMAGSGFANAIVKQMLPAIVQYTNTMADASKTTNGYQDSAGVFANAAKGVVLALDFMAEGFKGLVSFVLALGDSLGAAGDLFNGFAVAAVHDVNAIGQVMRGNLTGAKAEMDQAGSSLSEGWEKASTRIKTAWAAADSGISAGQQSIEKSFQQLFGTFSNVVGGVGVVTEKLKQMPVALKDGSEAADKAAKAAKDYADSITKAAEMLAKFQGAVDPQAKALQDYVKGQIEINKQAQDMVDKGAAAGHAMEAFGQAQAFAAKASAANTAVLAKQTDTLKKQGDVLKNYLTDLAKSNALIGLSDKEKAVAQAVQNVTDKWNANTAAGIKNAQSLEVVTAGAGAAAAFELEKKASVVDDFVKQFGQKSDFTKLTDGMKDVEEAIDKAIGEGQLEKAKLLMKTLEGMKGAFAEGIVAGAKDGLQSLQSMTTEGSKSFNELKVAIDLTTIAEGVLAIIHQLSAGDVYSAIPRAIAVAAAIMALGVDVKGISGSGGSASAAAMQTSQGTGSVLGDSTAKSESISKAVEITANATTQLVGLNRGMLTALQALQGALGAAGNQLARGAGNATFPGLQDHTINLAGPGSSDPIGGMLGSFLFGGSQKVIDQGIQIAGGALQDMLNHIVVGAYQTVLTSGGLFGSDKNKVNVTDITDSFGKEFQLVIQSIADTVKEGATALGLLPADIKAAMDQYTIAAQNISLQGLSADDQQKALEAVFSKIFDGLAGAVVPFIGQFQQVGEGLGETLVRVATEVQVTQEGFKQLGLSVAETDPEKFAQIADGLIKAAGGVDDFITGMQTFVANFSDGAHQLDVSSAAITSAFAQVGLTVPTTRDGMWELMQSLDATTDAGQKQIATLLKLADTSSAYYDQLDKFNDTLGLNGSSDFVKKLAAIRDAAVGLVTALSRAGASTDTLKNVYSAAADKMQEVIDQLAQSAQDLAYSLGLTNTPGSQSEVESEIARLQAKAGSGTDALGGFSDAIGDTAQAATDAMNLLLGNLSPLNDQQKLQLALQGLRAGTATQTEVLDIGRRLFASTEAYSQLFAQVQQIGDHTQHDSSTGGGESSSGGLTASEIQRLADLKGQEATFQSADRLKQFQTLAEQIAQLSSAKGVSIQDAIDSLGIKNADLEKGLTLANDEALIAYETNLQKQQDSDGENTGSIVDAIKDLKGAVVAAITGQPVPGDGGDANSRVGGGSNVISHSLDRALLLIEASGPRNRRPINMAGDRGR